MIHSRVCGLCYNGIIKVKLQIVFLAALIDICLGIIKAELFKNFIEFVFENYFI